MESEFETETRVQWRAVLLNGEMTMKSDELIRDREREIENNRRFFPLLVVEKSVGVRR